MDPLLRQEALVKKAQGDNYVGKRQAMVAARLQARGLKGRAYYDSADHSMQQQKKNQQAAEKEQEQSADGGGGGGGAQDNSAGTQAHQTSSTPAKGASPMAGGVTNPGSRVKSSPLGTEKKLNKFASESGSLGSTGRRVASKPESGALGGGAPVRVGGGGVTPAAGGVAGVSASSAAGGPERRVVSLGSMGANRGAPKPALSTASKPAISTSAPTAGDTPTSSAVCNEPEASSSESAQPAPPAAGVRTSAPTVGVRVGGIKTGSIGGSESGSAGPASSVSPVRTSGSETGAGGSGAGMTGVGTAGSSGIKTAPAPAVAGTGIRSTGIKIRTSGSNEVGAAPSLGTRTSNPNAIASVGKLGVGTSSAAAAHGVSTSGTGGGGAPAPAVSGVRTVKLGGGGGGVRSVNLGIRAQQPLNSMPKAYNLDRSVHRLPSTGASPLGASQGSLLSQASVKSAESCSGDEADD